MTKLGITFRDALNAQMQGWINVQQRANEIAKDRGRPLTAEEIISLTHCTMCGEPNGNCTHGE